MTNWGDTILRLRTNAPKLENYHKLVCKSLVTDKCFIFYKLIFKIPLVDCNHKNNRGISPQTKYFSAQTSLTNTVSKLFRGQRLVETILVYYNPTHSLSTV